MFFKLFSLEWKSFFRSANLGRSVGTKLLLGFLGVYFFLSFLGFGIGLYFIVKEIYPSENPVSVVNSFLLMWFIGEFLMRFLMQKLPVTEIKPLLTQRVKRNSIVHFLLAKTSYSFYNLATPTVGIPFVMVCLNKDVLNIPQAFAWVIALLGMSYAINYLNIWIQKRFSRNIKALLPIIGTIIVMVGLEYFQVYSFSKLFGSLIDLIVRYPILAFLPVLFAGLAYFLAFQDLKKNLYLDAYIEEQAQALKASDLSWTNRFGVLAPFLRLDLQLIWRNKRTKNVVVMCFFFLFYGIIFYTNPKYTDSVMICFAGVFISGIFIINYGQFIPAWDSSYFPFLKTRAISMNNYLEAKALLMYLSVLILLILSTPYAYFGWDIVYTNVACAIYNAGVNIPIILVFGAYNRKRIDLSQASMFNYQGIGAAQWLVGIPLLVLPIILWGGMKAITDVHGANLLLIGIGVIGLVLRKVLMKGIAEMYVEKRYDMIEGFRQKD